MNFSGWLVIGLGIFTIAGAVLDWSWFMNNRRAQFFVNMFSYNGARIFYVILGGAIAVIGALGLLGLVDLSE